MADVKAGKTLKASAAALSLLICAALGAVLYWSLDNTLKADKLFAAGDYEAAKQFYLRAKNEKRAADCDEMVLENRYLDARRILQNGDHERARVMLMDLGDYKDCRNLLLTCDMMRADELVGAGELEEARALLLTLGDYPGCEKKCHELDEPLYRMATARAIDFALEDACRIWTELGDYRDSAILAGRAARMTELISDPLRVPVTDSTHRLDYLEAGIRERVYSSDDAYFVIPEETNRETRFFLYFPGGRDEELYVDYFFSYLMNPAPNTLAVFLRHNGLPKTTGMCAAAVDLLEQVSADCGVFPHDVLIAGSSLGAYPAMHASLALRRDYSVRVPCLLVLDAGNDWKETDLLLSREECLELAACGTDLYLFESPWVGMDRPGIEMLVNTGNLVTLVGCVYDEHAQITFDALRLGVIDWALGDRTRPYTLDRYSFTRFEPEE